MKKLNFDNGTFKEKINGVETTIKIVKRDNAETSENGLYPVIFEASTNFPVPKDKPEPLSAEHNEKEKAVKALIIKIENYLDSRK